MWITRRYLLALEWYTNPNMPRLFRSMSFMGKLAFLLLILFISWLYLNTQKLLKGKVTKDGERASLPWGNETAYADVPGGGEGGEGGGGGGGGCPHVALYDGTQFSIENDFLPAEFKNIASPFLARLLGAQIPMMPDAVILSYPPQKYNGVMTLRLQEIELEESFVNWIRLERIIHPRESKIMIDAKTKELRVFNFAELTEKLKLPESAIWNGVKNIKKTFSGRDKLTSKTPQSNDKPFEKGDVLEFTFRGITEKKDVFLVLNAAYRDWMPGVAESPAARILTQVAYRTPRLARTGAVALLILMLYALFRERSLAPFSMIPFIIGGGDSGDSASDGGGFQPKSIPLSYRNSSGLYRFLTIHKPRSWKYSTEMVRIPAEAIQPDGSVSIRAEFTQKHILGFIGILQGADSIPVQLETLPIKSSLHSRKGDVAGALRSGKSETHLIPGDTIDVQFVDPTPPLKKDQTETYIMRSSGFYAPLRPKYQVMAGNWWERISPEARDHYETLRKNMEAREKSGTRSTISAEG